MAFSETRNVLVIGAGPIGLMSIINFITKPFFNNTGVVNISLTDEKGIYDTMMTESGFLHSFIADDLGNPGGNGNGRAAWRINLRGNTDQEIGLPMGLFRSLFADRTQVFLIKAEEFKDLHTVVKRLIKDVSCGHTTTPDNFNSFKCIVTPDGYDGGLQYSLEIGLFQIILLKAILLLLYTEKTYSQNDWYIKNKNYFRKPTLTLWNEKVEKLTQEKLDKSPFHLIVNSASANSLSQILKDPIYTTDSSINTRIEWCENDPLPPNIKARNYNGPNSTASGIVEDDNNIARRGPDWNNGAIQNKPGTCKDYGFVFTADLGNSEANSMYQYYSLPPQQIPSIDDYITSDSINYDHDRIEPNGEFGQSEYRVFPSRGLRIGNGSVYIGILLTIDEHTLFRALPPLQNSEALPPVFRENNRFIKILQTALSGTYNPDLSMSMSKQQELSVSIIYKIALVMKRFGISPYMINWTTATYSPFPLTFQIKHTGANRNSVDTDRQINLVQYYQISRDGAGRLLYTHKAGTWIISIGDAAYTAHYFTYSGVNNGLSALKVLFDSAPHYFKETQPNENECIQRCMEIYKNHIESSLAAYYQKTRKNFANPSELILGKLQNNKITLNNISKADSELYINEVGWHPNRPPQKVEEFHSYAVNFHKGSSFMDFLTNLIRATLGGRVGRPDTMLNSLQPSLQSVHQSALSGAHQARPNTSLLGFPPVAQPPPASQPPNPLGWHDAAILNAIPYSGGRISKRNKYIRNKNTKKNKTTKYTKRTKSKKK